MIVTGYNLGRSVGESQPRRRAVDTPEARRRDCRMTSPAFGRFFLPGPTDVHPDVLAAMQRPMIGHRSSAMEQILSGMAPQLGKLFRTTQPVMVGTASATGFMEMAVRNGVARRALSVVNGFSQITCLPASRALIVME